jgi:hypothetical protein
MEQAINTMTTDELISHLPKMVKYKKIEYSLIIYKYDSDYRVYYAKRKASEITGFDIKKPLLSAEGQNVNETLNNMNIIIKTTDLDIKYD